jgi:hypothetical protein
MSGKRPRIPPEQYVAYLRAMAQQQRDLAVEFDQAAERLEKTVLHKQLEADRKDSG